MSKHYTIYANNLYAVAATLVHMRIPFEFRPHHAFRDRKLRSPYRKSTIDIEVDEDYCSISSILYEMNEKYGGTFDFTIISES